MNTHQMFGLRRLSAFLRELPPEKFNMRHWSANSRGDPADLHACGTAGCIGGWSTLFFDGLRISRPHIEADCTDLYCNVGDREEGGYAAVTLAWGVTEGEVQDICCSTREYDSPADAADVIDALVEKYFIQE